MALFQALLKSFNWKESLEAPNSHKCHENTIFNHTVEALDEEERRKGRVG